MINESIHAVLAILLGVFWVHAIIDQKLNQTRCVINFTDCIWFHSVIDS